MIKKQLIKFRCTGLEKAIIQKKADNTGQSISSYVRTTSLGQHIGNKLTPDELEAYKMLTTYHRNFTAISNLLKRKDSGFAKEVANTAEEIKIHLKKFR